MRGQGQRIEGEIDKYNPSTRPRHLKVKIYAELIGNYKSLGIKSPRGNKLVCDYDYRGEYIVPLHNDTDEMMSIEPGERIAQLVILPFIPVEFEVVDELTDTKRGDGGFGSTGIV